MIILGATRITHGLVRMSRDLVLKFSQGSSLQLGPRVQVVENLRPREHAIHVAV